MTTFSASTSDAVTGTDSLTTRKLAAPRRIRDVAASRRNTAYPVNLVNDADVEWGYTGAASQFGWANTGTSQIWSISTDDAHSGTQCIKLAPTVNGFLGVQQTIDVIPGTTYTFSVWARRGAGTATIQSYFFWVDNNQAAVGAQVATPSALTIDSNWRRLTWTLTAPARATRFQFAIVYPNGSVVGDVLYLDDFQAEAGATASPFDPQKCYDTLVITAKVGTTNLRPLTEVAYSNGYYVDDTVARTTAHPRTPSDTVTGTDALTKRLAFQRSGGDYGQKNMVQNPGFENPDMSRVSTVSGGTGTITRDTSVTHSGGASLKFTAPASGTVGNAQDLNVPVEPSTTLTLSAWLYVPSSSSAITNFNFGFNNFRFFNPAANQGYINSPSTNIVVPAYDTWFQVTFTQTTQATCAAVNYFFQAQPANQFNAVFYLDDVQIERGSSATSFSSSLDSLAGQVSYQLSVTDSVPTPVDTETFIPAYVRAVVDAVTLADVVAAQLVASRFPTDVTTLTDALARYFTSSRVLDPEITAVSDDATHMLATLRGLTEVTALADSLATTAAISFWLSDDTAFSEQLDYSAAYVRPATDVVQAIDDVFAAISTSRLLADMLSMHDDVATQLSVQRALFDVLPEVIDTLSRTWQLVTPWLSPVSMRIVDRTSMQLAARPTPVTDTLTLMEDGQPLTRRMEVATRTMLST